VHLATAAQEFLHLSPVLLLQEAVAAAALVLYKEQRQGQHQAVAALEALVFLLDVHPMQLQEQQILAVAAAALVTLAASFTELAATAAQVLSLFDTHLL
jgi:hypothetical protein